MCYAGGPYCYGHSKERYNKAYAALKENPSDANIKKFRESVKQLDTTPQGISMLQKRASNEKDADSREQYRKRLEQAQKTVAKQEQNKNREKLNKALDKIEEESTPTPTGHINLTPKQANKLAKAELSSAFPETKFSVREKKEKDQSSMIITYDNPDLDAESVRKIAEKYQNNNSHPNDGFSIRGRSMSTSLQKVAVENKSQKTPHHNDNEKENFNRYKELSSSFSNDFENATREQRNLAFKWARNHDKEGKYIYKGANHVDDEVTHNGTLYRRVGSHTIDGEEYYAGEPYSFRIQVNKDLTPEEAENLSNLTKYAYSTTGGEKSPYQNAIIDTPNSIIVHVDTTKNRAYRRLDRFFDGIHKFANQGTPTRKDGTRAVQGVTGISNIEIYADHTTTI